MRYSLCEKEPDFVDRIILGGLILKRVLSILPVLILILTIGCGEDITQTSPPPVPELTSIDIVRLNSQAVRDADVDFAA
jgi:hypothetical protein